MTRNWDFPRPNQGIKRLVEQREGLEGEEDYTLKRKSLIVQRERNSDQVSWGGVVI